MIVVADTSPINYLVLIDEIRILPEIFGRVIIPKAVARELQNTQAPPQVTAWIATHPAWLDIQTVSSPQTTDADLERLGSGEREAIQYAFDHRAEALLLIDEGKGRREASNRQIRIIGHFRGGCGSRFIGFIRSRRTIKKDDISCRTQSFADLPRTTYRTQTFSTVGTGHCPAPTVI